MNFAQAMTANARTIARLSDADLRALLPILGAARDQTARSMASVLKKVERDDTYTIQTHRQMLAALTKSLKDARSRIIASVRDDLSVETSEAGVKALGALMKSATAGAKKFNDSAVALRFDKAQVVLDSQRSLMSRHSASAVRYAGRQGDQIKKELAIGLLRGDSIGSVVTRLMGRDSRDVKDGDAADAIAERGFFRSRADAERLVRTENIHAANATQMDALQEDNERAESDEASEDTDTDEESGGGEGGWLMRWDSTFDKRTCDDCDDLDGEVRAPGEEFDDGVLHPPLHANCRCAITPWREGWEL